MDSKEEATLEHQHVCFRLFHLVCFCLYIVVSLCASSPFHWYVVRAISHNEYSYYVAIRLLSLEHGPPACCSLYLIVRKTYYTNRLYWNTSRNACRLSRFMPFPISNLCLVHHAK